MPRRQGRPRPDPSSLSAPASSSTLERRGSAGLLTARVTSINRVSVRERVSVSGLWRRVAVWCPVDIYDLTLHIKMIVYKYCDFWDNGHPPRDPIRSDSPPPARPLSPRASELFSSSPRLKRTRTALQVLSNSLLRYCVKRSTGHTYVYTNESPFLNGDWRGRY